MENSRAGCLGLLVVIPFIGIFIWALLRFNDPVDTITPTPPRSTATPTTTVHAPHHHRE